MPVREVSKSNGALDILSGTTLSKIEKVDFGWVFHFSNKAQLNTETPWRVVSREAILLTSEDHGQKFGLPAPIDAVAEINKLLANRSISSVEVDVASCDLCLRFDGEKTLEIVNLSSGYECWVLRAENSLVVGRNGDG